MPFQKWSTNSPPDRARPEVTTNDGQQMFVNIMLYYRRVGRSMPVGLVTEVGEVGGLAVAGAPRTAQSRRAAENCRLLCSNSNPVPNLSLKAITSPETIPVLTLLAVLNTKSTNLP